MIQESTYALRLTNNEKKVLKYLIDNSRISDSSIAGNIGISTQAVRKIREKLEIAGIIKNYFTKISYSCLGISIFSLLLIKCNAKGINLTKNLGGESTLVNLVPNLIDVYKTQNGEITHIVLCGFKNLNEYNDYISIFQSKFNDIIEIKKTYIFSDENIMKDSENELIKKIVDESNQRLVPKPWTIEEIANVKNNIYFKKSETTTKLSENEKFILKSLIKNSRIKDNYISKNIGISKNAVGKIRKKLENNGVISSYSLEVDFKKLGINVFAMAFIENSPKAWQLLRKKGILKSTFHPNITKFYDTLSQKYIAIFGFRDLYEVDAYFHKFKDKMCEYFNVDELFIFSPDSIIKNSSRQLFCYAIDEAFAKRKSTVELSMFLTLFKNAAMKDNAYEGLIKVKI